MILFYKDGKINRVRIDFADMPNLKGIGPVKMAHDRMTNEKFLFSAAMKLLNVTENESKDYSVLAYQREKVWLTYEGNDVLQMARYKR
jgi:hypothetical protein